MISIDDFQKEDGTTDWDAYNAADKEEKSIEVDNGECCSDCGKYIFPARGYPVLCGDCKSLKRDTEAVTHNQFIRCPECRETTAVDDDHYDLFEDGGHDVCCQNCDADFRIITHVSYSFESPAIGTTGEEDE